jgi:regulator of protease activity HflC (stomatin/prohibitin superfamily)
MEAVILTVFGKPIRVSDTQGIHWIPPVFITKKIVNLAFQSGEINLDAVPDKNGSPMQASLVVIYRVTDAVATEYNIKDNSLWEYIEAQAVNVLMDTCRKFSFKNPD